MVIRSALESVHRTRQLYKETNSVVLGVKISLAKSLDSSKPPSIKHHVRKNVFSHPCWRIACLGSIIWVMPQTRSVADALGVVTIIFVSLLVLVGLICIIYSLYLRSRIRNHGFTQLGYFGGPWIIRIVFIIFAIWWGIGEIVRLSLLRQEGRVFNAIGRKWQKNVCKGYIVSNLGFAEPCLFLTLVFLLRGSLQKIDSGELSRKWNQKTAAYVLIFCLPVFILQLVVILMIPKFPRFLEKIPQKFMRTAEFSQGRDDMALCTYPLFSTILLGLFASLLTLYLFWLGRRIVNLVINKGLKKRVYSLIFSVSSLFPLRILFLGLSVLSKPEHNLFEAFAFLGFFSLFCCAGVGIYILVYCPVADCLDLRNLQDVEARRRFIEEHNETLSLIANQGHVIGTDDNSPERTSVASTKRGSISFRVMEKGQSSRPFVELSLFSPSQHSTPPDSPQYLGWPMLPNTQDRA